MAIKPSDKDYHRSVFINCPFDSEYREMFEAMIFVIHSCGFIARCAKERMGNHEVRIAKIVQIIKDCKYAVHDLSRSEYTKDSPDPRFNMPYELGLFSGAQKFGGPLHKLKTYLVVDREKYRYQQTISDISGRDIEAHNDNAKTLIGIVRNWLKNESGRDNIPGIKFHTDKYEAFQEYLLKRCTEEFHEREELTFSDYSKYVNEFNQDWTFDIITNKVLE